MTTLNELAQNSYPISADAKPVARTKRESKQMFERESAHVKQSLFGNAPKTQVKHNSHKVLPIHQPAARRGR